MGTQPPPQKGPRPTPQFPAHIYCDQTAGCMKMPLGMEVGLSPGDFVFDGDPASSQKGGEAPIFGPCLLRPNGCMDQGATWYGGRPRFRRHCVRCGPSSPPQKKGGAPSPIFLGPFLLWPNGWMHQMPLGIEVGLGVRDIVLDEDSPSPKEAQPPPSFRPMSVVTKQLDGLRCHLVWRLCSMGTQLPPEKKAYPSHTIFGPCPLWPNGWMNEDATWYGSTSAKATLYYTGSQLSPKGAQHPPLRPMSIMATVAHLSYC